MLGADVGVSQLPRLGHGKLEDLLRTAGIWQVLASSTGRTGLEAGRNSGSKIGGIKAETCEHLAGDVVLNLEKTQQLVLGPYVLVMKPVGFLPRGPQNAANSDCKVVAAVHFRRLERRAQLQMLRTSDRMPGSGSAGRARIFQ